MCLSGRDLLSICSHGSQGGPRALCFQCSERKEIYTDLFRWSARAASKSKGSPGFLCSTSFFQDMPMRTQSAAAFFFFSSVNIAVMHSNTYVSPPHLSQLEWNKKWTEQEIIPQFPLSLDALEDIICFFTFDIMNDNWESRRWKWLQRAVTKPKLLNYAHSSVLLQQGGCWKLRSQIVSTEGGAQQTFVILRAWLSLASFSCTERKIFN